MVERGGAQGVEVETEIVAGEVGVAVVIEIGAGEAEVAREMTGVVDHLGKLEDKQPGMYHQKVTKI